jgi:hypothetical protein
MMEAENTSETSVNLYQATRRYNPEDSHLHTGCCGLRIPQVLSSVGGLELPWSLLRLTVLVVREVSWRSVPFRRSVVGHVDSSFILPSTDFLLHESLTD